jgi:hypothetical protein
MILKENGNDDFFSLVEVVRPPAFVETSTRATEVLTSRLPILNDTPRALSYTDRTCFFTGLTLECSPCPCFAFFADFGLEDMRKDPRLGLGARRSAVKETLTRGVTARDV